MGAEIFRLTAFASLFSVTLATETHADIYKHVDKNGGVTYSNKAISGANKLPENLPFSTNNSNHSKISSKYLNVNNNTQAKRDLKRRQILENELAAEMKLFVNAKQSLINAQKNAKAIKIKGNNFQESLTQTSKDIKNRKLLHKRNITALRKELAN